LADGPIEGPAAGAGDGTARHPALVVVSALWWTAVGVLVLVITWPGRWTDAVGRIGAALGSVLALTLIGIQVARVVAVARHRSRG
jgi:hypothetical protein